MKRWSMIVITILILFVTACSSETGSQQNKPANDGNNSGASTEDQVNLTMSIWGNEQHQEMLNGLFEEFYKTHPNVNVTIETVPYADYQQKMSVLAAGKELPDIGWVAERMAPQFMANGILRDLSSLEEDADFKFDDIIPSTLDMWRVEDKLYGIPFSTPPMLLYYNKSMFEDANLPTPNELAASGEWTWEKLAELAKQLSDGEGAERTYGVNLWIDFSNYSTMMAHTWSNGGELFNENMTDFIWDEQKGLDTFEYLKKLMFEDRSHVPPGEVIPFEGGKLGMYTAYYSYISRLRDLDTFEWDIAPLPAGSQGNVTMLGMAGLVAFEDSDHPEEALELLKFLMSPEGIEQHSQYFVPPRESVLSSEQFISAPGNPSKESMQAAMIDQMATGRTAPLHENWSAIESEIIAGFDVLFAQSNDPEDILKHMNDTIDPLLN